MDMDLTYRGILKWGDKREAEVEPLMKKLIKEKFGLTDSDFGVKHLPGIGDREAGQAPDAEARPA